MHKIVLNINKKPFDIINIHHYNERYHLVINGEGLG